MTNRAAVALANRKWRAIPKEQRSAIARKAIVCRWHKPDCPFRTTDAECNCRPKKG